MNQIEAVIASLQRKKASDSRRLRLFTSGRCWREYSHIHRMKQSQHLATLDDFFAVIPYSRFTFMVRTSTI